MLRERKCEVCGNKFGVVLPPSRQKSGRGRFCSVACKKSWSVGRHFSKDSEFKKGMKMVFTPEHRRKISEARRGIATAVGSVNGRWMGDKAGYHALHHWVIRTFGKASICEKCGSTKNVQWANKSFAYKRDKSDWLRLCYKCHREYDRKNGWGLATKKFPEIS
jgi:hypothetical protein